jgi:hypothetical protein
MIIEGVLFFLLTLYTFLSLYTRRGLRKYKLNFRIKSNKFDFIHETFVFFFVQKKFLNKHFQFLPCFTYSSVPPLRSEDISVPCLGFRV